MAASIAFRPVSIHDVAVTIFASGSVSIQIMAISALV